jgi:hypothetical protein
VRGLALADFDHDGYTDIVYFGTASGNNSLKVFLHTVNNPSLAILPDFPKGMECFMPGSVQFVKWQSSVPSGPNAAVTIDFSSAGANGPWTTVASNISNTGTYQWVLPNVSSNNCYLKYTITQNSNSQTVIMSNAFGIGNCTPLPPTGINEVENSLEFGIYPNPSSVEFTVSGLESETEFSVYNILGEKIFSKIISGTETINLNTNSGVYFCKAKAGTRSMTQKLVLVK